MMKAIILRLAVVILTGLTVGAEQPPNILPPGVNLEPTLQTVQTYAHTNKITIPAVEFPFDEGLTRKLEKVIRETQQIKVGMTRADLRKVYSPGGGISTQKWQMYDYGTCPYIHVEVEFEPVGDEKDPSSEHMRDIITKISRPFLDFAYNN